MTTASTLTMSRPPPVSRTKKAPREPKLSRRQCLAQPAQRCAGTLDYPSASTGARHRRRPGFTVFERGVDGRGAAPALRDRPDHERLATPCVARGEDARE